MAKKNSNNANAGLNKLDNVAAKPSKEAKKNSNDANVGLNKLGNEAAKPSKKAKKNSNDANEELNKLGNGAAKLSKEAKKNSNNANAGLNKLGNGAAIPSKGAKKKSNGANAELNKLGNGAANPGGNIDLDKAGVDLQNVGNNANEFFTSIGNKIRAFFVGGWTRNEYIGFWVTFGILVAAVLVGGLSAFDTEAFAKAYTDLKKFGNDMEKVADNTGGDIKKIGCDVQDLLDSTRIVLEKAVDNAVVDIKKIGCDMQESMDSTSMDLEKFNSDVIGAFETCNEDIDIFGRNVEEVVNKDGVGKLFWNVFDKATEEIQKVENMLKK